MTKTATRFIINNKNMILVFSWLLSSLVNLMLHAM